MGHQFASIAFTDNVQKVQQEQGSRSSYAKMDVGSDYNHILSPNESRFIQARDSFYMASVGQTGWPYMQHRGGPVGFMRVLDEKTLGFADFRGNRQYVSTGNFRNNDRISLFFMDYPNKTRLKLLGRVRLVEKDDIDTLSKLDVHNYQAKIERGFLIDVKAFDWNCPQHIEPRFNESEIRQMIAPLIEENKALKSKLA